MARYPVGRRIRRRRYSGRRRYGSYRRPRSGYRRRRYGGVRRRGFRFGRGLGRYRPAKKSVLSAYNNKSDTVRPAHQTNNNTATNIKVGGSNPNTFILYCPTARGRPAIKGDGTTPLAAHTRFSDRTYVSGYKESVDIWSSGPFIWRRVVFWSYQQAFSAQGPKKGGSDASAGAYHTRQMTPVENDDTFRRWIFAGTQGVDYDVRTLHQAPLNHKWLDVAMDKTYRFNGQGGNLARIQNFRHFYPGGVVQYADQEFGNVNSGSPWSVTSRGSKGNMYILDIFSDGGMNDSNSTAGRIQCEGKIYWSE